MSTVMESLLTLEQFQRLPDDGRPRELVRGRVIELNVPKPRHGFLCGNIYWELSRFVRDRDLGRVMTNDSGVVTEHDPDSLRGPDISYYSYNTLPRGPMPKGYLDVVPELVFEVRSPTDRLSQVYAKIAEYLAAGVRVVCLLDEQTETLTIFNQDDIVSVLSTDKELTLPDIFGPDFRVPVSRFFAE